MSISLNHCLNLGWFVVNWLQWSRVSILTPTKLSSFTCTVPSYQTKRVGQMSVYNIFLKQHNVQWKWFNCKTYLWVLIFYFNTYYRVMVLRHDLVKHVQGIYRHKTLSATWQKHVCGTEFRLVIFLLCFLSLWGWQILHKAKAQRCWQF